MSQQFILFGGRQVPININYPVYLYNVPGQLSFYDAAASLGDMDKIAKMAIFRPDLRTYSWRPSVSIDGKRYDFNLQSGVNLVNVPIDTLKALGQAVYQVALHHDVTTDAKMTFNVLCTRGLSTHFVVNYDGALYQFLDGYHVAWATGENNAHSIAIDMNNPVYPEARATDPAGALRDIYQGKINGSVKTMLGYTEAQYETIIALLKAFITPVELPDGLWTPMPVFAENCFPPISETGDVINGLLKNSIGFKGFLGHYHCSAQKWDPGPAFDWLRVLSGIKGERNSFPILISDHNGNKKNLSELGGQLFKDMLGLYYSNAENASGGWYPMGSNQSWHSGIHLTAPEDTEVLSMMSGTIVAVRNVKTVDLGDPSFVLIRHSREEDIDGKKQSVYWYSLYMHLQPMIQDEDFSYGWVHDLLGAEVEVPDSVKYDIANANNDYEKGIPQVVDGTGAKNKQKVIDAFFRGDIVLTELEVKAGMTIGKVGKFGRSPQNLERQVHIEVFSEENIFQRANGQAEAWSIIEGDETDYSIVRVKKLIKPVLDYTEEKTGRRPFLLKSMEIQEFYGIVSSEYDPNAVLRDGFRKMICFHKSEWSPQMNWTKTAIQSVGWQWESEASFGAWLIKWLPFQWMTEELTTALKFPKDNRFFTYHPIYLLEQLNLTYAGDVSHNAEEASEDEAEAENRARQKNMDRYLELQTKLKNGSLTDEEKRELNDISEKVMDDDFEDGKSDISSNTNYEYFNNSEFEHWEPGEWMPPKKKNSQDSV